MALLTSLLSFQSRRRNRSEPPYFTPSTKSKSAPHPGLRKIVNRETRKWMPSCTPATKNVAARIYLVKLPRLLKINTNLSRRLVMTPPPPQKKNTQKTRERRGRAVRRFL